MAALVVTLTILTAGAASAAPITPPVGGIAATAVEIVRGYLPINLPAELQRTITVWLQGFLSHFLPGGAPAI